MQVYLDTHTTNSEFIRQPIRSLAEAEVLLASEQAEYAEICVEFRNTTRILATYKPKRFAVGVPVRA